MAVTSWVADWSPDSRHPNRLRLSPENHSKRNQMDRASADCSRAFSRIWGTWATSQQPMDASPTPNATFSVAEYTQSWNTRAIHCGA